MNNHYDAVVIGLGAVGSFALRALSKTPGRWLGIERFSLGAHARGSSHGMTRIYRRAYFEHPHYVPWIEFSLNAFRELQDLDQETELMHECGMLLMAPKGSACRTDLPPLLAASAHAAAKHDIPVNFLENEELATKFPQFRSEHDMVGLLEPNAGILRPERVIQAAQADAQLSGYAAMIGNTAVTNMRKRSDGKMAIRVQPFSCDVTGGEPEEEREIVADTILVSAGAWTSQLLPQWAPYLTVTRQIQAWIDTSQHEKAYSLEKMPAWFMETPDWQIPIYGTPADTTAGTMKHWIKVGTHCNAEQISDPSTHSLEVTRDEYAQLQHTTMLGLHSVAWTGHAVPHFVATEPCLYTMTPDGHFLVASPSSGIFGVSACCGHGFKMAPALGAMMADFALGKDMLQWRLDFCNPERFKN
ncbi:hypothetical protein MPSEU_000207400 [Mayamaea pseudoterrestris]|nr:hypothetical protein MPSEU_000207400 [Mayamaea pseudoterrestris]